MRLARSTIPTLVLAVLAAATMSACGSDEQVVDAPVPVLVQQPAEASGAVQAFAGEVRARHETPLSFRVGGKVATRAVDVGDRVVAGQVLAELDAQDLRLNSEGLTAQRAAARADERLAQTEFDRVQVLSERQLVSRSLLDARQNALDAAKARRQQAEAQSQVAGNQASYAVLRAPADGVVALRQIEAGQVVTAGQMAFGLAEDGEREVAIALPEGDVARFAVGQSVQVELWAAPDQRLPGTVREIAPAADPQARTFATRISLALPEGVRAELGGSARVYARNAEASGVAVPLSALLQQGGKPMLWVLDAERMRVVGKTVETGPYGEAEVPILAGLAADDWVVVSGAHLLREGQRVAPVDRNNRPVTLPAAD